MEQIEVNNQSSNKSGEVSAAIAKLPESRECAILPSQNGSTTSCAWQGHSAFFEHVDRKGICSGHRTWRDSI
jgi:hypothetical protein